MGKSVFSFERPLWQDRLHGAVLVLCGAALLLAPYRTLGWGFRLLPWLLLALAVRGGGSYAFAKPERRSRWKLLPPLLLLGAAAAVWLRPDWSGKVIWYGVAFYWLYSAIVLLKSAAAPRQEFRGVRGAAGALTLVLALGMLWFPRSGYSTALRLSGAFGAALGVVLVMTPPKEE